ncbi:MAG: O-antigen ligase family protein [Nitrospirae bacterium]|nr:O-antigen ligase family protein [Nitrospirota bacterium]
MLRDIFISVLRVGAIVLIVFLFFDGYEKYRNIALYISLISWFLLSLATFTLGFKWKNIAFVSLILLMFSAIISSSLSGNAPAAKVLLPLYTMYLMPVMLYAIVSAAFNGMDKAKMLCTFLALLGVVRMFYTVFVYGSAIGVSAPIDNETAKNLSLTAMFLIPFMFAQYAEGKGIRGVLWFIIAILSFAGLLFVGVRASWVAVFLVGFIWTVFLREKRFFSVKLIIISAIVVLIMFRFYPAQFNHVREHIVEKNTISMRLSAWKTTVDISRDSLITGHGLDTALMRDKFVKFATATGVSPLLPKQWPDNVFLSILYMQGAVGVFFFAVALFYSIIHLLTIKSDVIGTPNFTAIAIMSAIVAEIVMRVFFFDGNIINLSILLAMAGSVSNKASISE